MAIKKVRPKPILFEIIIGIILILIGIIWLYLTSPVDRNDNNEVEVKITSGVGIIEII